MRQVNFSIPIQNKASVGITTALYDRRALDCTSTLPLFNSLNYLAHLTISSARIRQILTEDGGVERLVCILKKGRAKGDIMDMWKWNLAFQCVVNIGVRGSDGKAQDYHGSEKIRTRVVEADIVPVIATVLDNYQQVIERIRRQQEDETAMKALPRLGPSRRMFRASRESRGDRRREAPPPIEVPQGRLANHRHNVRQEIESQQFEDGPFGARPITATSTEDRMSLSLAHQRHRRYASHPGHPLSPASTLLSVHSRQSSISEQPPLGSPTPTQEVWSRVDASLLPPMTSTSQPDTPMTPHVPGNISQPDRNVSSSPDSASRPSIQRQHSGLLDSDEEPVGGRTEPMVGIQGDEALNDAAPTVEDMERADDFAGAEIVRARDASNPLSGDGSNIDPSATPTRPPFVLHAPTPEISQASVHAGNHPHNSREFPGNILALVPRDEDVVSSLQLLAYVSKYCELRSYFQQTHLVPRLKIRDELQRLDGEMMDCTPPADCDDEEDDLEYCQVDDYNIFPLVEKFTVRHYSHEMKYWAGVVMRNLCRKDKTRGDIRQCAYYKCGKWEEFARQFAKCRRCRQTKYCSKECQKRYVNLAVVSPRNFCR